MALKKIKKNELYKEGSAYKESQERIRQQNEEIYKESKIQEKMDRLYEEPKKQSKIGLKDILTGGSIRLSNGMVSQGGKDAIERIIDPNKAKQEDNRKWFEPGAFKDGYQAGDLSKTVTGTLADVGQDLTKGVAGIGEGLVDTTSYLVDLKSKWEADYIKSMDKSKLTEKQRADLLKRYIANRQVSQDIRNFIQRDLIEESKIGNIAGNTGVAGEANKLLNNRTDNKIDAFETDSVLGDKSDSLVQSAGQLAGQLGLTYVGVPWWVTSGTTAFAGGTEEAFNNGATEEQAGMYGLINAGAEILSEKISGGISFGGKTLDTGLKEVLTKQISNRTVKALTNFGFDATGEGLEEVVTQVLTRLGQKLTYAKEDEWKGILSSPEAMDKWINETINHLTNEEARAEYGESFIGGAVLGGGANTIRLGNSLKNNVDYDTGLPTAQTIQGQNQVAQNSISEQTEGILNNKELPMQSYQYEISDNAKINNLRQDANRYFNNSEKARNYVNMLEKIITDKDIEIRLDGNLKTADGRIANGSYYNGVITINPNSTRAGEFIAIHELTHAIGTKEMLNMINTYRQSNAEFDTAVKGLLQNYEGTEITEEALSDVAGQLFGNQEFINNIAQNNPNIFQKLYSEIKYLWHQFRGYKNQNEFVEDLYYKWTQAYNSNNKLNDTSNYYIETVADFNEIEYNNAKELKLPKREYAILSGIVNSDSNIKPGINYVETTNATYEVYFKEIGEFKVVDKIVDGGYNDTITNGNIQRTGSTRDAESRMQVYSSTIQQPGTRTRNDEISNFNQGRTRISDTSIKNGPSNSSNVKYSIQESENNSGSFSMQNNKDLSYQGNNGASGKAYGKNITVDKMTTEVEKIKEKYSKVIDSKDNEAIEQINRAKDNPNAEITIYRGSLNGEINEGDWVFLSKTRAERYTKTIITGKPIPGYKVGELKVKAKDVDWTGKNLEFVYTPQETDNQDIRYSQNNKTWQEYLDENFKPTGTRTSMQDILPTANIRSNTQIDNITNIEEPKTTELPNNDKSKVKENKIAKILSDPVKNQKPTQRTWAILQANLIDKGAVFETLSLKTKNRELQAKYDATLSSSAKGQYAIGNDRYIFENGKQTLESKSLSSIIEEVGENATEFYDYMYHQLNVDRMTLEERYGTKNKPVFSNDITAEYSMQKVEEYNQKYPEFKSYAQDVYDFLDANKRELVNSGVISQELSNKFKEMYPHYVPIARIGENNNAIQVPLDTKRTGINNPIKKATGSSKDIQPMFHTIADRTLQTYRASARNAFGVELKNTLEKNNLLNATNENTDIDTIIDTMADEQQTGLTEGTKYRNPTFTVFENGEKVTYDINQDMYDALKPQNELITKINNSKLSKIANKISNIRRGVLTEYNPLFSITNAMKDAQEVVNNSQHPIKTYEKFPEAYVQIMQKGYWYNEYIQNGGEQNSYFKDGDFNLDSKLPKAKNVITMPFRAISKVNNVIEMAPRLAEYIASRENGSSIQTSMLDASRVTTNFKAGGDITKTLNRNGATFLNAGVQGMAQQIRNIREAHAKGLKGYAVLATKTIFAGMPALILNNLVWGDDEEYEDLQDYVKDSYYIVGKIGDNQFIRIPKGRTTAVIQKLFTTADKYITKGKEINIDNFAEDFWTNLLFAKDNIAPNNPIDNNIASPIAQVLTNKTWYGEDLVPTRLQDVPKAEQYDETTDKFSKWVGEKLNISPIKINYLLDQYGGGISDVLLPLGTPQAENNPIEDKFTTNSVMKSKYPGEFFEKVDELKVNSNSINATDEDELKYKYISSISKETSDLYKKKREIQNSTLTDEEKKNELIKVQKQINSLAKEALEKVDTVNIKGDTATIGGKEYYKTTDVKEKIKTWKKLSDEEVEKNKSISLSTYTDYKEKVAQETIKQRKSGDIKEDGSIKDKDKMSILINSMYSNKEKQALYENYIKEKEDSKYDIIKTVSNFNINSYLEYKIANSNEEFKADRKDDGTLSGKTISGSAKNKKFNYIGNMKDTPYMQKAILFGLESTPNKSDKTKIVNYITTLSGKTNKEKLEMLDQFTWVTIYKDGSFRY